MYLLQNETIVDGLALYFMTEVRSRIELYGASAVLSRRRVHIGMIFRILSRTHRHTATSIHHIDYVQQRLCIYFSVMTSSVHVAPQRHGPFCTDVRMCVCVDRYHMLRGASKIRYGLMLVLGSHGALCCSPESASRSSDAILLLPYYYSDLRPHGYF